VPLWQNMGQEAGKAPAEFLSTHPSSETRIDQLVGQFGKTLKLYNEAKQAGKTPSCSM
jgi:predicted Zn-dependent protease